MWQINRLKTNCTALLSASRELIYWGFEGFFFYPFSLSFFGGGDKSVNKSSVLAIYFVGLFSPKRHKNRERCPMSMCQATMIVSSGEFEMYSCSQKAKRDKIWDKKFQVRWVFFLPLRPKWDKPPPIIIRNIIIQSFWQRISSILFVQNLVRNTWSQNKSFWMLPLWGHWGLGQLRQIGSPHEMPNKGTYWAV